MRPFSVYLHETDLGRKRARLMLERVDGFLTGLGNWEHVGNGQNTEQRSSYILPLQQVKAG